MDSIDPPTGARRNVGLQPSNTDDVNHVVAAAFAAHGAVERHDRLWRAGLLDALAGALDGRCDELAHIADRETALGAARLTSEVRRSAFQFRLFAEAVREGGYLEAAIDHAADTALGPAPDIRRMLFPLGVVTVFGASNFPFAFSVAGGDTASALAGGNAVVVKAHESHLETSRSTFATLTEAAASHGAPDGLLGIVYGKQAGVDLLRHPRVSAVGFTGSLTAGRALLEVIAARTDPIPFYGELSSLNPLVVTPSAATARGVDIADDLYSSFTLGAGQFCTKPGIAFVPSTADGQRMAERIAWHASKAEPQVLLNGRIRDSFNTIRDRLIGAGARLLASGSEPTARCEGFVAAPTVLATNVQDFDATLAEEAFGPLIVLVRYSDLADVYEALDAVPHSLTATIHHTESESDLVAEFTQQVRPRVGRIVYNGYPTGVRVSWAQHHGGPWPATNTQHTSVGVSAIRRFLRPVAFQAAPHDAVPLELRDDYRSIPRRVDGALETADPDA